MDEFKHDHDEHQSAGMSRAEYRRQLIHHDDQESDSQSSQPHLHDEAGVGSREDTAQERKVAASNEKMLRLKRRLNIAIVALVVAIVIVYLILFFVKWKDNWHEIWNYLCNARRN